MRNKSNFIFPYGYAVVPTLFIKRVHLFLTDLICHLFHILNFWPMKQNNVDIIP